MGSGLGRVRVPQAGADGVSKQSSGGNRVFFTWVQGAAVSCPTILIVVQQSVT